MENNHTDALLNALRFTQKLRASVGQVFHNLADGCQVAEKNEKQLLSDFHESLLEVNNDFSELEKLGNALTPLSAVQPNSIYLSIDPAIDKSPVYCQVLQAYKWSNKVGELASYAVSVLDQHCKIKRTLHPGIQLATPQAKRLRRNPPTGHAFPPNHVETVIARVNQKTTDLSIIITRPLGSHAILQVTLGRILKAQIALRGLMVEWVNVRGYTEENMDDSKLELWEKSRYQVFQKVTESATAAMLHFYSPITTELSLSSFIHWFQRYKTLFSAPCQKCGKHYLGGLPPTWRDLRTTEPYHDVCRQ